MTSEYQYHYVQNELCDHYCEYKYEQYTSQVISIYKYQAFWFLCYFLHRNGLLTFYFCPLWQHPLRTAHVFQTKHKLHRFKFGSIIIWQTLDAIILTVETTHFPDKQHQAASGFNSIKPFSNIFNT